MEIIKTHDLRKVYNIGDVCVVALKNNSFITNPDAAVEASASQPKNLISILGCIVQSDSEQHWFSAECFSVLSNEQRDQAKEQAHMLVFLKFHLLRNASSPEKFLMPLLQPAIPDDVLRKRATELIVQLGLEKKQQQHLPCFLKIKCWAQWTMIKKQRSFPMKEVRFQSCFKP
ncbi:hypothetical protein [Prosthecochloris sp.]|uniref:hypothetical protein n=1 Tax=Prosthecochloris sp. TaxID=290513 RepID=UPI002580F3ED|nr:hypothetical protein [Prosthecochloris sp.]